MSDLIELTDKETKQIWKKVCKRHHIKYIYSRSLTAWLLKKGAKKSLRRMGVTRVDEWLAERYMTLLIKDRAYILTPFKIGSEGHDTAEQVMTLAHELSHVFKFRQLEKENISWLKDYFLNGAVRGEVHEAPAEAAGNGDVRYKLKGRTALAVEVFTDSWAKAYTVTKDTKSCAMLVYLRLLEAHKQGIHATRAGSIVCKAIDEIKR